MKKNNGNKILSLLWTDSRYHADVSEEFFNLASRAMAELSSGIIYIMLPSDTQGTGWWYESLWNLYEWPSLGSAVTEVIRVNPDNNHQETNKEDPPLSASSTAAC